MKIVIAAAVAMTAFVAPPVGAEPVPNAKVYYGDLDTHSAAGMATLKSRVAIAAHRLCGDRAAGTDFAAQHQADVCFRTSVEHAMQRLPGAGIQVASR